MNDLMRECLVMLINEIPYDKADIDISEQDFCIYAARSFSRYSGDEIKNIYRYIFIDNKYDVFKLIEKCTEHFIDNDINDIPVCKTGEGLRWRQLYFALGQDMFTSMYYASLPHLKSDFTWKPVIDICDTTVNHIADKEIAENHFHLNGSTQIFHLNFICLMNNIAGRHKQFNKLQKYLNPNAQYAMDGLHIKSLYTQCAIAAAIRLYLYAKLKKIRFVDKFFHKLGYPGLDGIYAIDPYNFYELNRVIEAFKLQYGKRYKMRKTFDYINPHGIDDNYDVRDVFAGERYFLYLCFQDFGKKEEDKILDKNDKQLLYSYLIIKNKFRNELIQTNKAIGFQNFSNYQNRKALFIDGYKQYEFAAIGLALNSNLDDGFVNSIEARICPKNLALDNKNAINYIDGVYNNIATPKGFPNNFYYVLHFPKKIDKNNDKMRHDKYRRQIHKQSRAIFAMLESPQFRDRVRGIDACSNEIGCRPEVYAPAFRYLLSKEAQYKPLNATYHVGEDFLDITDGLRAIDEVITYIFDNQSEGMKRLGHALALGINADNYYNNKNYELILTKQDAFDNVVWLLGKTAELNISVNKSLNDDLRKKYNDLSMSIYSKRYIPEVHYQAWKLRGDHPDLYTPLGFRRPSNAALQYFSDNYKKNSSVRDELREDEAGKLYYQYHYDTTIKKNGYLHYVFKVHAEYAQLVTQIQEEMIKQLKRLKISVEVNPSSNVLIGALERYEKHPIFRFVNVASMPSSSICASINTDDLGIFDTSLQNEYALIATAMKKNNKYNSKNIKAYLNQLRKFGIEQKFI